MIEAILSLAITTALLFGSPGPATMALAGTGATFGFRRGTSFLYGILCGLTVAITAAATGLATLFNNFPSLRLVAQTFGAIYIVYIAYKIATAPITNIEDSEEKNVPRFRDGFILNLVNVKAYAAFFAIFSQFLLPFNQVAFAYLSTGIVCIIITAVVDVIWLWFGSVISPLFIRPRQASVLRVSFAVAMLIAVAIVII